MQAAYEPASTDLVLHKCYRGPSVGSRGAVIHGEEDAGRHLQDEEEGEHRTKDVGEAGSAEDVFVQGLLNAFAIPGSLVEPIANLFQHERLPQND